MAQPQANPFNAFSEYLRDSAGLAPLTVHNHIKRLQFFFSYLGLSYPSGIRAITPRMVSDFVIHCANTIYGNDMPGTLRRFFLYRKQLADANMDSLLEAIPKFHESRHAPPKRLLSIEQVNAWLGGFDRRYEAGRSGYAMAVCMAELGLRPGDLVRLQLDDLDWKGRRIRVHNHKRGRPFWLPLPRRTGAAIVDYLRRDRDGRKSRFVFLRTRAPREEPLESYSVFHYLKKAAARAGIPRELAVPYSLRHSLATNMRAHSVDLKCIGDVLGHTSLESTKVYARVAIEELRAVAMPWREEAP